MATVEVPNYRSNLGSAKELCVEAKRALVPLGDDLKELSPSFGGLTLFALDMEAESRFGFAADVATVYPQAFYDDNIRGRRVLIAATTLGECSGVYATSKMNPNHVVYNHAPGVGTNVYQVVFDRQDGRSPQEAKLRKVLSRHAKTCREVAGGVEDFQRKAGQRIGRILELEPAVMPNAYILSWDITDSTTLNDQSSGVLDNYIDDARDMVSRLTRGHKLSFKESGDGDYLLLWLSEYSKAGITRFGETVALPLMNDMRRGFVELSKAYSDIAPEVRLTLGLGCITLGDAKNDFMGDEFWRVVEASKTGETLNYTEAARRYLCA